MAFGDFKYPDVLTTFGLTFDNADDLFAGVAPVPAGLPLRQWLPITAPLAALVSTEKARSEGMISPILTDFWSRYHGRIGMYSGAQFNADPEAGLNGFCDYIISRSPQQMIVTPPVLVVFEAKNESVSSGLGQCVAGMVGAQRYNVRLDAPSDPIYGCVTTGTVWRFLRLSGATLTLDLHEYVIGDVDQLLGIFTHIVGPPPPAVAA